MLTTFWYDAKSGEDRANAIFAYLSRLKQDQSYVQDENFRHMRLYGNLEAYSLRNYGFYRAEPSSAVQNRVTLNIVQSMVDTVVSKLSKNKPRPSFLTDGGDWTLQRRAKKLSQFVEGQFYLTDYYAKRTMALQDSCIFGTGALKVFRIGSKICLERIFIDELIVDDAEALYGQPRQIHQRKYIHRDVLKAMFPKKAADIDVYTTQDMSGYYSNSDKERTNMVEVAESWRLRDSEEADNGIHTICVKGLELYKEKYSRDYFPFLMWRWGIRPMGFWGQGLAEQLTGIQLEINKILRTIQVSMHLVSVPKIFVEASAKIVSSHLNNKIGGIVKYVGQPPIEGKLGSIPSELFAHLDRLYGRAFEIAGISQLSAMAAKPQGLNSGKALREFNDIESERFMAVAQRDEQMAIEAAKMFIDLAKEIDADEDLPEYKVKTKGTKFLETLKWKDVALDEDAYLMQCFPVSALSKTPAGRLQDVQELMQSGLIGKEDGMKLLDFPDLQQFYNFNNAGLEDIERTIEEMIDKGNYSTPEPYQNLQLGIIKMQQAYLLYKSQGAPEARLELFRRWMEDADALIKKSQEAVAVAAATVQNIAANNAAIDAQTEQRRKENEDAANAANKEVLKAQMDAQQQPAAPAALPQ